MDKDMEMILEKTVALRHELHRHPELSLQEKETKQRLMDFLKRETSLTICDQGRWFYAVYPGNETAGNGTVGNGVMGKGNAAESGRAENGTVKRRIAIRADFDALPIPEEPVLPYASENPGVSHRCGHDGHASALCGLALLLERYGCDNEVYLIFQHAEEIGAGAAECAGLLKKIKMDRIYAFHNWSGFPEGSIVVREGVMHCASRGITFFLQGKNAHASRPEDGRNPSQALAELVLFHEKELLHRDYRGKVLSTIVHVRSGAKNFGIAAGDGEISMTIRSFYEEDCDKMETILKEKAEELAGKYGLTLTVTESDVFPETVNDREATEDVVRAAESLGFPVIWMEEPVRSSEDFGYFQKECPGALFFTGNGENYPAIHMTEYDFNDRILPAANRMFGRLCGIKETEDD